MPEDASTLYARNLHSLLELLETDEGLKLDMEDEILAGSLLTHDGEIVHEATAKSLQEVSA
jgi:NAD(P) transhydrogenase subunit alpha